MIHAWRPCVSAYDPGCFRLVRTYGIVIVKLNNGGEYLIPFLDQLYFENIPDNTGAVGLVFYEYAALDGACTASVTPYQEVASGYDNEKFSGDYGTSIPPLQTVDPTVTIDKQATPLTAAPSTTLTFTMAVVNEPYDPLGVLGVTVGNPSPGIGVMVSDEVPADTTYVPGSAVCTDCGASGYTTTILYSADGLNWTTSDTGTVNFIR